MKKYTEAYRNLTLHFPWEPWFNISNFSICSHFIELPWIMRIKCIYAHISSPESWLLTITHTPLAEALQELTTLWRCQLTTLLTAEWSFLEAESEWRVSMLATISRPSVREGLVFRVTRTQVWIPPLWFTSCDSSDKWHCTSLSLAGE